jgi:uncharacterized protein YecE (DUF72 family)
MPRFLRLLRRLRTRLARARHRALTPSARVAILVTTVPPRDANAAGFTANSSQPLRIGPAGWAYQDWAGVVYPAPRPRGFDPAAYLAQFFDTIEINSSFYHPFTAQQAKHFVERVAANSRFLFTAKLWQRFTHDPGATAADEREVRAGFDALMSVGKLGAVLVQFPFAFHRTGRNIAHLAALLRRFASYPLVVEFRHASWNAPDTFALLREWRAGFCNIDQPVIGRSLEPSAHVTSDIGYVRLHGRRYDTWFASVKKPAPPKAFVRGERRDQQNADAEPRSARDFFPQNEGAAIPAFERYNYLYSEEELRPWVARIENVHAQAKSTYVVTNNHYLGKGVVNALQLISILKGAKIAIPDQLREPYLQLNEIAADPPATPTLFPMGKTK